jgi:hypothetical protein
MSAVSITINREPISRGSYDGASDLAKIQAEIFERLVEIDAIKLDRGADLCRRLAALYDLSPFAYRMVLRVGSGDISSIVSSYEDMRAQRGVTKQAVHYELTAEIDKIRYLFPEVAAALHQYRDNATRHHRVQGDGESARDVSS